MNLSRWLFLRFLGAVFLIAFASLWVQVEGLLGSRGVLPVADVMADVRAAGRSWIELPTLLLFADSDLVLHVACGAGVVVSVLVVAGVLTRAMLAAAWVLYLSFVIGGTAFMAYQWDALLLETAVVGFLLAPGALLERPARDRPAPLAARLLVRVLLFKLMFLSGFVKLGDEVWRDGTALRYHYWTQPLPTWPAWYAHQLPGWFHRLSVWVMFAIELVAPFLLFLGRRARHLAAASFVFLMALIALTGNYNFFNLLTVALCVGVVDDEALRRVLPERMTEALAPEDEEPDDEPALSRIPLAAAAALLSVWSALVVVQRVVPDAPVPAEVERWQRAALPWHLCNRYGLFADMTTERCEITIEGSRDGRTWEPYRFRWKPELADERPRFVEPHQPRLDWDLWFAALRPWDGHRPFLALCRALLQGREPVLGLFEDVPFPDEPPRFVRAEQQDFRFTTRAERAETGDVWVIGERVPYSPVLSLDGDRLVRH